MPYTPTSWVNGTTALNATHMTNLESQFLQAMTSFNADLFTPCVISGYIASKDGTTANQLDVTAGVAYVTQPDGNSDNGRVAVASSTQTTSTINTTYNLYLQPNGTWYWSTSNSPAAGSLFIATVTTDGAGNILVVTDKRTLATSLLSGILQGPGVGHLGTVNANTPQPGANPGSIVGGVTAGSAGPIAGDSDNAMSFDGTTGYITVPNTSGFPSANAAWSLEAWINASALPASFATAVAFGAWGTTRGAPNLSIDSAGHVIAGTFSGDAASATTITANTWHHLVGTWDGTTLRCYLDGTQVATATPGALVVPSTPPAIIGADTATTPGQMWKGLLDEVAIYSTTLSAGQVTAHYNAGHAGSATSSYVRTILGDSPLRYYRLGDASGRGVRQAIAATAPVVAADGSISPTYVAQVGSQSSVGQFGVPVTVSQPALRQHITVTTNTALTYAVTASGIYRMSVYFALNNGTSGQPITIIAGATDPDTGTSPGEYLACVAGPVTVLNAATLANGLYSCFPVPVAAQSGTNIVVNYRDNGGTPNDYVSVIIERLA